MNKMVSNIRGLEDLPEGNVIKFERGILSIPDDLKESLCVYGVGKTSNTNKGKVWLLAVNKKMEMSNHYLSLQKNLQHNEYEIENKAVIQEGTLKALISLSERKQIEKSETEDNKYKAAFQDIISHALSEKVSDIHFEKRDTYSRIRMRRHGELLNYTDSDAEYTEELCRVIYNIMAENESKDITFMPDDIQQAAIKMKVDGIELKLRYQSIPAYPEGFDVVLRVLPIGSDDERHTPLNALGYSPSQEKTIIEIIAQPVGSLIIAGTTGSGKSTTLKNLLMFTNVSRLYKCKIYTIEDPPEYKIPGVTQVPIARRKNDTSGVSPFAAPLIATMRADPDILMIGEIRDIYTGDGMKKATQSGHQVMTTVHAASALGIIDRLKDFGITANVMGSPEFLNGLIYQKLLPTICQHCAIQFSDIIGKSNASKSELELAQRLTKVADMNKHIIKVRNEKGCEHCKNTGVTGRTVCAEIIRPDFTMLKFFRDEDSIGAYQYWRSLSDGEMDSTDMTGKTALEHALYKMRQGLVCPFAVEESFGHVDTDIKRLQQMSYEKEREGKNGFSSNKPYSQPDIDFDRHKKVEEVEKKQELQTFEWFNEEQ